MTEQREKGAPLKPPKSTLPEEVEKLSAPCSKGRKPNASAKCSEAKIGKRGRPISDDLLDLLEPFEQLLTVFRQFRARSVRFAGFLLFVALDQARFIIRSRDRRNDSGVDADRETVIALKMVADRI
jgi:hypothetical protein